ncbi:hypothetical protein B0O80DRAFT_468915 [Mortierella sp. GBAus27b]|nr:hypothetical protein BGX31_009352 [Mortierella sp. GBA43]KAI8346551.1 hypothetical protein B0O80DRAFT_468915 [Mortierella sp. GBAus27b]
MGYTFDIELEGEQTYIVKLDPEQRVQTLYGAIMINLNKPETFKVASIAIHGHAGVSLSSAKSNVIYERLVESYVDLVAANDTEGHGTITIHDSGALPFRIDIPRPAELPPTLINRLDNHNVDWRYEIHATLKRDSIFATTQVVKHELLFRRPIVPQNETTATLTSSTDMPGQFRSKLSLPSQIMLGQERLTASIEMKSRSKQYLIKEIECQVVQIEDINYFSRFPHADNVASDDQIKASRVVSSVKRIANDESDLDFGRHKPIELDLHLDNFQLIPTERGLEWLEISHVFRFTVHFMDVGLEPVVTEMPLFVGHEEISAEKVAAIKASSGMSRLVSSLTIAGTEDHVLHTEREGSDSE